MATLKPKIRCVRCGKKSGGTMRFISDGHYVHLGSCTPQDKARNGTHANWPLTTRHINGEPMVLDNLRQLRAAEQAYGVSSEVYNQDSSNRNEQAY